MNEEFGDNCNIEEISIPLNSSKKGKFKFPLKCKFSCKILEIFILTIILIFLVGVSILVYIIYFLFSKVTALTNELKNQTQKLENLILYNDLVKTLPNKIIYYLGKSDKYISIFGNEFVKNNQGNCYLIINGIKENLTPFYNFKTKGNHLVSLICDKKITNMNSMFANVLNLEDISTFENWDVSDVKDMSFMFYNCKNIKDFSPIKKWDVSKVENMELMFSNVLITDVEFLYNWKVFNVKNMYGIFENCNKLENVNGLIYWNVSSVIDFSNTFSGCKNLVNITGLAKWDVSSAEKMVRTFANCVGLTDVSCLSGWDISNVKSMDKMFEKCVNLVDSIPEEFKIFGNLTNIKLW